MRLITYKIDEKIQIGALKNDKIIPFLQDSKIPLDMLSFLKDIDYSIDRAKKLYKSSKIFIDLKKVKILKPINRPPKIIAIGLNYADHLDEIRVSGRKIETPSVPMIFNKQSLSANGPFDDIIKN